MCTMNKGVPVGSKGVKSEERKKPSRRQRRGLKVKQEVLKVQNEKIKKREQRKQRRAASNTIAEPVNGDQKAKSGSKKKTVQDKAASQSNEKGSIKQSKSDTAKKPSLKVQKRISQAAEEEKTNVPAKKSKSSTPETSAENNMTNKKKNKRKTVKKAQQLQQNVNNQAVPPPEPEVEPDKNWKELSKKLGIDVNKKQTIKSIETEPVAASIEPVKSKETTEEKKKEIWFDDVDEILIEEKSHDEELDKAENKGSSLAELEEKLVTKTGPKGLTKCLAMDCEMVGVGPTGDESVLARISVVNQFGHCVYDKFVKPQEEVTDYRTWVSGVRPEDLESAEDIAVVQKEVDEMFKGRILVGHAISNDWKVLFMNHHRQYVRDTQTYSGYRTLVGGRRPGLKLLAKKVLGIDIQSGEHSSVQDAQATMRLYTLVRDKWEKLIKEKRFIAKYKKQKQIEKATKRTNA